MTVRLVTVQRRPDEALRDFSTLEKFALTVEITLAYVQVRWLMRRGDLRAAVATVRGAMPREAGPSGDAALAFAARLGSIVGGRLRHLPGDTRCLARSLVLTGVLARRGLSSTLVIGVSPEPDFKAHAWVEHLELPVLPSGDGEFQRLVSL